MPAPLTLYHSPYCGYCIRVRLAADKLGIDLDYIDVRREPGARRTLHQRLGRGTVPVLRIREDGEDVFLPESRDIIAYLERRATTTRKQTGDE